MKSLSRFLMACSLIFATAQVAFATTVERFRPYAVDVPAEASQAWSGALSADSQAGAYGKTGGGELTFPLGSVLMRNAFTFNLWEGSLKLTDDGTSPSVDTTTPPAVMNSALLWLEAGVNYGWKDEAAGTVETWYDRREASVGGTSYPRAVAANSNMQDASKKAIYYAKAETAEDQKSRLYFNGLGEAGSTMVLSTSAGAALTVKPSIVFVVYDARANSKIGNLLGARKDTTSYFQGDSTVYFNSRNSPNQVFAGGFYRDGVKCDAAQTATGSGRHLIEWECGSPTEASFNALFDDRGYAGRSGGDGLCEVVAFTRSLTTADRLAVEEYLMQKWIGKSRAPSYAVRTEGAGEIIYNADTAAAVQGVKISGAGTLVKTGSADMTIPLRGSGELSAYEGRIRVAEGKATVEAASLDYAFKGGDNVSASVDATTAATYDTVTVANGVAGDAKAVEVAGDASVRISGDFPAGVETLKFSGRELILSDVIAKGAESADGAPVEVEIKNPGFEGLVSADFTQWGTGTKGGWTITGGSSGSTQWTSIFRPQGSGTQTWYADHDIPPPEGEFALGLSKDCSFSTAITIPEDGVYDLTFYTSSRVGYHGGTFEMSLIDKDNVSKVFGHVTAVYCCGWVPRRFSTGFVKAGDYTLKFRGLSNFDCASHFDDFRMFRTSRSASTCEVAIPNGDFERAYPDAAGTGRGMDFTAHNSADGWTLTQTAAGNTFANTDVAITLCGSAYYNAAYGKGGNGMLGFFGNGGTATTDAFTYPAGTLPAGTYRLRANVCAWLNNYCGWSVSSPGLAPNFVAKLTVNGIEKSLGSVTAVVASREMSTVRFPNAITLDGTETLSLTLQQTTATSGSNFAAGLVDNLVLERVAADVSIANADFEANDSSPTSWTLTTFNDQTDEFMKNSNGFVRDLSTDKWTGNYGSDVANGCGARVMFLVQQAQIAQSVTFPSAGRYRLSFWTRARPNYGGNAIHAFLADASGSMVKDIGMTAPVYTPNFFKQDFVFDVTAAECGTSVRLVLKGVNGTGSLIARNGNGGNLRDANIALDGVAITRVTSVADFAIDENVELKLAAGTKLRLDFEGSRTVKTLKIGGKRFVGTIDASHESGLVSGTGTLIGKPSDKGLFIVVQ